METFVYRNGELYCEDVRVADLAREFGTPLWISSRAKLVHEFRAIRDAFAPVDPLVCYAVKANSNLSLLKVLHAEGCGFDIVSGGELFRVKEACGETSRVVFAGVGKTAEEIRFALENDILMFNVESEPELHLIGRIAAERGCVAPVALRLNPDIDAQTYAKTTTGKKGNKFGMDIERFHELAVSTINDPFLKLCGIHLHLGSAGQTTEPHEQAAKKALDLVLELRQQHGYQLEWINLGGGFGLNYRRQEAPSAADYAKVILPSVQEAGCRLILEPGRPIAGNAGVLLSTTIYVKREGGKRFIIQDAAMNDLVRPAMYDAFHRIWPVQPRVAAPDDFEAQIEGCELADVVGPICESGDYLAKDRWLPPIEQGELLCTFSAGAYGTVMSSNYNSRPRAAEILVDGDSYKLIRRRETLEDLVAAERV